MLGLYAVMFYFFSQMQAASYSNLIRNFTNTWAERRKTSELDNACSLTFNHYCIEAGYVDIMEKQDFEEKMCVCVCVCSVSSEMTE